MVKVHGASAQKLDHSERLTKELVTVIVGLLRQWKSADKKLPFCATFCEEKNKRGPLVR